MEIKKAEFVKSSTKEADCPNSDLPEYAFIGRSNVGKSSLINLLTNRKKLAKTSSTPGKTQLINHFLINDAWFLVDLPGYGWARVGKQQKADWKQMIEGYLKNRSTLANVFVLVDSRHEPQPIDLEFIQWLGEEGIAFGIVFTKTDKLGKTQQQSNIAKYKKRLKKDWDQLPPLFKTSSTERIGREEILEFIDSVNAAIQG